MFCGFLQNNLCRSSSSLIQSSFCFLELIHFLPFVVRGKRTNIKLRLRFLILFPPFRSPRPLARSLPRQRRALIKDWKGAFGSHGGEIRKPPLPVQLFLSQPTDLVMAWPPMYGIPCCYPSVIAALVSPVAFRLSPFPHPPRPVIGMSRLPVGSPWLDCVPYAVFPQRGGPAVALHGNSPPGDFSRSWLSSLRNK